MEFLLLATAHFLALLSPGPDFFLVVQASIRLPFRYCIMVCAGIASANALYLLCAIFGLELVKEWHWLLVLLKYLGAGYLIFLGAMLLRAPRIALEDGKPVSFLQVHHLGRQFLVGFLSGFLNPKNMIFYLSLFTAMVSAETSLLTKCFYGLWMSALVFFWDIGVVLVVCQNRVKQLLGGCLFWVEKISGVMLMFFGMLLSFA